MCDALLSCDFLDSGLLGELKSLGEVVGLTLAVEGLGIFTLMDTSLRCLHETNKQNSLYVHENLATKLN